MAKKRITVDAWSKFKRAAKERQELSGDLPGFFYVKLANGGAWRLRYTDPSGAKTPKGKPKRITATIAGDETKPDAARAIAEQWRVRIRDGIDPSAARKITEAEQHQQKQAMEARRFVCMGTFFDEIYTPHKSALTYAGAANLRIIKNNFGHLFSRDMDTLTAADIRAWEKRRKAEGVTRATLTRAMAALKGMLSYAAGTKKGEPNDAPVLTQNPLEGISLSPKTEAEREAERTRQDDQQGKRGTLTADDVAALRRGLTLLAEQTRKKRAASRKHGRGYLPSLDDVAYPHWFEPFCHLARLTGARPGDILRWRWNDLQTDLRARCEVLRYTPHKTAHHDNPAEVVFPLTGELADVLKTWRQQQGNPSTGLMLKSERTGGPMDRNAYPRHWSTVKTLAGLPDDMDFYNLRHTFISDRVNAGWPLLRIARLVGHKTTEMIAQNYYREDLDDLTAVLQAMESTTDNNSRRVQA